jgi:hypothetical protein
MTVVVSSSRASNALGRALTLADVAGRIGPVEVWAFDDGPLWRGAAQWGHAVTPFTEWRAVARRVAELAGHGETVVWLSKSFPPLGRLARWLRLSTAAIVIADFDDDDLALIREYRASSVLRRATLNAARRTGLVRVGRSQHEAIDAAHAVTVSTFALARRMSLPDDVPVQRVVHARERVGRGRVRASVRRIGFLGTIRPHKGIERVTALVASDPRLVGVTFAQAEWSVPSHLSDRWVELEPSLPLADAYDSIDVSVVPSDADSDAARVQLPAKAIDAVAAGVQLLATPTPALDEVLGDAYLAVSDWRPATVAALVGDAAGLSAAAHRAELRFAEALSVKANASRLLDLLVRIRGA